MSRFTNEELDEAIDLVFEDAPSEANAKFPYVVASDWTPYITNFFRKATLDEARQTAIEEKQAGATDVFVVSEVKDDEVSVWKLNKAGTKLLARVYAADESANVQL